MIQSKIELIYDARNGEKKAIIEIGIESWVSGSDGVVYSVADYTVNGNVRVFISSKSVFYSWDQINSMNVYLEKQNNFAGLNKKDLEYKKIQLALLIETQTRPVYGSTAQNWELKPEMLA